MSDTIGLYLPHVQIQNLKKRGTLMTCEPKFTLEKLGPAFINERFESVGRVLLVADEGGKPQAKAKLLDCFITTFGQPDAKFVSGMGFGTEVDRCQNSYRAFWERAFPGTPLTETTELLVTVWESVREPRA